MEGIEFVLHEAALPSVQRSVEDPIESDRVNVYGTLCLLKTARKAGVLAHPHGNIHVYGGAWRGRTKRLCTDAKG